MLRHALFSAVVAAATALVVPTAQQVSHSLSIPVSAGYGSAIAAQGEVQSSFQAATLASIQDAFSLDDVTITGVDFASSQRRRAQGGDSKVTINYVVMCGSDGCLSEKDKLDHVTTKQMTNIIQAIDDHAFATGFGTSAVCSGSVNKNQCASKAIAALDKPSVVTIPLPKSRAPTQAGKPPPPTPKPTAPLSLCVKANPCFTKKLCTDDGKGGATCGKCPSGYSGDGKKCADMNDCSGYSACGSKGSCKDSGTLSNTCACSAGYSAAGTTVGSINGQKCVLTNKCSASEDDCVTGSKCNAQSGGGHSCSCPAGTFGDGKSTGNGCKDINGCANKPCDKLTACSDISAPKTGFSCGSCPKGYTGNGYKGCKDANDCTGNPCGIGSGGRTCKDICTSGFGGSCSAGKTRYTCTCLAGFAFFGGKCRKTSACHADLGEKCPDSKMSCNHDSSGGSFSCSCPVGTIKSADSKKCVDKNDCLKDSCSPLSTCHDMPAPKTGFTCDACPKGYKESWNNNKQVCTDIDDCIGNPCGAKGTQTCNNQPGIKYTCTCKKGYLSTYHCADMKVAAIAVFAKRYGLDMATWKYAKQGVANDCQALVSTLGCKGTFISTKLGSYGVSTPCQATCKTCGAYCDSPNKCQSTENDCSKDAVCNHPVGALTHACSCKAGFSGNGKQCADTNGCANSPCDKLTSCTDVSAPSTGFKCSACPKGYSGSGSTSCNDIDDCSTSKKCVAPQTKEQLTCVNKPGTAFSCDCGSKYFGANGTCYLKNACALNPCAANSQCNSASNGKYTCSCNKGYTGDGAIQCNDVDGCTKSPCDKLTTCKDVAAASDKSGSDYTCTACPAGYAGRGDTKCSDVDDCIGNPCGGGGQCSNDGAGTGNWKCKCSLGYSSVSDNSDFTDKGDGLSKLVAKLSPSSVKANHYGKADYAKVGGQMIPVGTGSNGAFTCADAKASNNWNCQTKLIAGYWFGRSYSPAGPLIAAVCRKSCGWAGPVCSAADSCSLGSAKCDKNAACSHVVVHGSTTGVAHSADTYKCTCKTARGFVGNGKTCTDQNACQLSGNVCGSSKVGDVSTGKGCCHSLVGKDNGCSDGSAGASWSAGAQFSCKSCPSGYTTGYAPSTFKQTCTDISDCAGNPCGAKSSGCSEDGAGSGKYKCACVKGYAQSKGANGKETCMIDDECAAGEDDCVSTASCIKIDSSNHGCKCGAGFSGNGKNSSVSGGTACTDINECTGNSCWSGTGASGTQRLSACTDLAAAQLPNKFTCASCPTGFKGSGVSCSDIDDCANSPCGKASGTKCTDAGTNMYKCTCTKGYSEQGDAKAMKNTCVLANSCAADEDDCVTGASCNHIGSSTSGQHTCICPKGTKGDGKTGITGATGCVDIDGCASGPCSQRSQCTDISAPGTGFTCGKCPSGYEGSGVGSNGCTDIDFCKSKPCATLSGAGTPPACTDKQAPALGFRCDDCPTGYDTKPTMVKNQLICMDTNGCATAPCSNMSTCSDLSAPNTGFKCAACASGYKGNGIGANGCVDIDDCATSPCGAKATGCKDKGANAYSCTCSSGYSSLGSSTQPKCVIVNSCASSEDDCVTVKTGTVKCNHDSTSSAGNPKHTCTCPTGYKGDGTKSGSGCADIDGCANSPCATLGGGKGTPPKCTDQPAGASTKYTCAKCPSGYNAKPSVAASGKKVCVDFNACASNPCFLGVKCADESAPSTGNQCGSCPSGTEGNGIGKTGCVNTDGCKNKPCPTLSGNGIAPKCFDVSPPGTGFTCAACPTGYDKQAVNNVCQDTNGCASAPCDKLTTCKDVAAPGTGFKCSACPSGYSGNGVIGCKDINDCNARSCAGKGSCKDTGANSFSCSCNTGYTSTGGSSPTCQLKNACSAGEDDCVKGLNQGTSASCNHLGSGKHSCSCPSGYVGDGKKGGGGCKDVNGCSPNLCPTLSGAGTRPACTDVAAPATGYTCAQCPTGYDSKPLKGKSGGLVCMDSDGCKNSPCSNLVSCADEKAPKTGFACGSCPSGYAGNGISAAGCQDVDDCANSPCGKKVGMQCSDAGTNKYTCSCPTGYASSGTPLSCNLVNSCQAQEDDCVTVKTGNVACNHIGAGQHTCTCPKGYKGDGTKSGSGCTDPDECASKPCPTLQGKGTAPACTAQAAPKSSFTCGACPTGYDKQPKVVNGKPQCADTNACAGGPCHSLSQCTDLKAPSTGFTCSACPSGYSGNAIGGKGCTDINDCAKNPCTVAGKGSCKDTGANTRQCTCAAGYVSSGGSLPTCSLQDTCKADEDDCVSGLVNNGKASCNHDSKAKGSHTCSCPSGYKGDGKGKGNGCTNVNGCSPNQCAGLPGAGTAPACTDVAPPGTGYTCASCPKGYDSTPKVNSAGKLMCVDPDGCANSPCSKLVTCADNKAPNLGYTCGNCPNGYVGNGVTANGCQDKNDCASNPCGTKSGISCKDQGTLKWSCTCPTGYSSLPLNSNQPSCQLVNACKSSEDDCVSTARCLHDPSSKPKYPVHSCACPKGTTGNGVKSSVKGGSGCTEVDGCAGASCPTLSGAGTAPKCTDVKSPGTGYTCGACPTGYDKTPKVLANGKKMCMDTKGCNGNKCTASEGSVAFPGNKYITCKDTAAPGTGATCSSCSTGFKQSAFVIVKKGRGCAASGYDDIKSLSDCSKAFSEISLTQPRVFTAADDRQNGVTYDPSACYYEYGLKFNVGKSKKNTGYCTRYDNCICKVKASAPANNRRCADINDCTKGSTNPCGVKTGLTFTCKDVANKPNTYKCTCPTGYASVGTGTPKCQLANQCSAKEDDCVNIAGVSYKYVYTNYPNYKDCEGLGYKSITSLAACSAAGKKLKLRDTTASDDKQNGVGYDPKGCYYEGGSLKFNVKKTNKGKCTYYDRCLCAAVNKATCNHKSVNGKPTHSCTCPAGFYGDGKKACYDTDGCGKSNPCPTLQGAGARPACTDVKAPGTGFTCAKCPAGYNNPPVKNVCIDPDGCANSPCDPLVQCSDIKAPGTGFSCAKCPLGYVGNGVLKGAGSVESKCTSPKKQFSTFCAKFASAESSCRSFASKTEACVFVKAKYTGDGCSDLDDCKTNPCGTVAGTKCVDKGERLAYTCTCPAGYSAQGSNAAMKTCKVSNSCKASLDDCVTGAKCNADSAAAGGHTCSCSTGFEGDGKKSGKGCKDINGCSKNPCPFLDGKTTQVTCTDKKAPATGSTCAACPAGYLSLPQNKNGKLTCVQIDACKAKPCDPLTKCSDEAPPSTGFVCGSCPSGYKKANFKKITKSTCSKTTGMTAITSTTKCIEAAKALGLKDTYNYGGSPRTYNYYYYPKNCFVYYYYNDLRYNTYKGTERSASTTYPALCESSRAFCADVDDCADSPCGKDATRCRDLGTNKYSCSCKTGYSSVTNDKHKFKGPICMHTDACKSGEDDCVAVATGSYQTAITTRGYCTVYIDSINECNQAAKQIAAAIKPPKRMPGSYFAVTDTTASDDRQNGVGYDPKGCYYEYGLKFNAKKTNKGRCSYYDTCLCKPAVKAKCNHDTKGSTAGKPKHTCTCPTGFAGDGRPKGTGCKDFNACATNKCATLQGLTTQLKCTDLKAPSISYTCAGCPTGYDKTVKKLSSGALICVDTDGCANSPCSSMVSCNDIKAPNTGFMCGKCPSGYEGNGVTANGCKDIDDCKKTMSGTPRNSNPCGTAKGTGCFDQGVGKYKCTCALGYTALPVGSASATCTHIDACKSGENDCVTGLAGPTKSATCNHVVQSTAGNPRHTCSCPAGYAGDGKDPKQVKGATGCKNVDGCAASPCPTMPSGGKGTAPKCIDQAPPYTGYTCTACPAGFDKTPKVISGNKKVCVDTNGCTKSPCDSRAGCTDVVAPGSGYKCGRCPAGMKSEMYKVLTSGTNCKAAGYYDWPMPAYRKLTATTKNACQAAAKDMGISDTILTSYGYYYYPPGCFFYQSGTYINLRYNGKDRYNRAPRGKFSNYYRGICKSLGGMGEKCVDVDDCKYDEKQTERKANPCGTAAVNGKVPTCKDSGTLKYTCTCPTGYASVPNPTTSTPVCKVANACAAEEDDCMTLDWKATKGLDYVVVKTGTCHTHGKTKGAFEPVMGGVQACTQAAQALKSAGKWTYTTTAKNDNQKWVGYSYDPPGCYYEYGRLKWNQGKGFNTGSCTAYDQCICLMTHKATCNHVKKTASKPASHTCACPAGYAGDGKDASKVKGASGCKDFNACATKPCPVINGGSGPQPTCKDNSAPSTGFVCSACPNGYEKNFVVVNGKKTCKDLDGCKAAPCHPDVTCADKKAPATGRTCGKCPSGKFGNGEPFKCHGNIKNGASNFCTVSCKCAHNEGHCDNDAECNAGTTCESTVKATVKPFYRYSSRTYSCGRHKGGCKTCQGNCGKNSDCPSGNVCARASSAKAYAIPGCKGRVPITSWKYCQKPNILSKCMHLAVHHTMYEKRTTGQCPKPVFDTASCLKASGQLGITDKSIRVYNYYYYPRGCFMYYYNEDVRINKYKGTKSRPARACSTTYPCLCESSTKIKLPKAPPGCTDINDCIGAPCGPKALKCTDTGLNKYSCSCPAGYASVGNNNRPTCQHADACKSGENNCVSTAKCNHGGTRNGKPWHTCTCQKGMTGDGITGKVGCKETDGCKVNPCATLPSGGFGTRPKCTDNKAPRTGATCAKCPSGYNSAPGKVGTKLVCTDKNDCSATICGPASTKSTCQEARAGSGIFTCKCPANFAQDTLASTMKPFCFLDQQEVKKVMQANGVSFTCAKANTEAALVNDLIKLCPKCGIKPLVAVKDVTKTCNADKSGSAAWCGFKNTQSAGSTIWKRGSRTPSGGTGASKAKSGSYFFYSESSGSRANKYGYLTMTETKIIKSASFQYNMYGRYMGALSLQKLSKAGSSTYTTVWSKSGAQTNSRTWKSTGTVKIGQLKFRITMKNGRSYTSDASVDDIAWTVTG